jgi:hypothetical protein
MLSASQGVLTAALFDLFGDLFVRGMAGHRRYNGLERKPLSETVASEFQCFEGFKIAVVCHDLETLKTLKPCNSC